MNYDPKNMIDSAHPPGGRKSPHDREQLRRRLLQMILKNEAERRAAKLPAGRSSGVPRAQNHSVELAVYDPDDKIGRDLASGPIAQKRA